MECKEVVRALATYKDVNPGKAWQMGITKWCVVVSEVSETYSFMVGPFDFWEQAKKFQEHLAEKLLPAEYGASVAPWLPSIGWVGRKRNP